MSAIRLSDFVNAAHIGGADSPHVVVEKLQAAIDQASPSPSREAVLEERMQSFRQGFHNALEMAAQTAEGFKERNPWPTVYAAIAKRIRALKSPEPEPSNAAPQIRDTIPDAPYTSQTALSAPAAAAPEPTIIKDFPSRAVEDFRKRHSGKLPSEFALSPLGDFEEVLAEYDKIVGKLPAKDAEADFVMRGSDWREIREQIEYLADHKFSKDAVLKDSYENYFSNGDVDLLGLMSWCESATDALKAAPPPEMGEYVYTKADMEAACALVLAGFRSKPMLDKMVDRFLAWPLPDSVCADMIATRQGPGRIGTNLLTATEARLMLDHVLAGDASPAPSDPELMKALQRSLELAATPAAEKQGKEG